MRDPRTQEWADEGDAHSPLEAVATHEQRPQGPIWNRVMFDITGDVRYLFDEVEGFGDDIENLEDIVGDLPDDIGDLEDDLDAFADDIVNLEDVIGDFIDEVTGHNHDGDGVGSDILNPAQVSLDDDSDATREVWTQVNGDWDDPADTHYLLVAQTNDTNGRLAYDVTGYRETGSNSWTVATLNVLATISSGDETAASLSVRNGKENTLEHNPVTCEYDGSEWLAIEIDTGDDPWGYDGGVWYTGVRRGIQPPELAHHSDVFSVSEIEDEGSVSYPNLDVQNDLTNKGDGTIRVTEEWSNNEITLETTEGTEIELGEEFGVRINGTVIVGPGSGNGSSPGNGSSTGIETFDRSDLGYHIGDPGQATLPRIVSGEGYDNNNALWCPAPSSPNDVTNLASSNPGYSSSSQDITLHEYLQPGDVAEIYLRPTDWSLGHQFRFAFFADGYYPSDHIRLRFTQGMRLEQGSDNYGGDASAHDTSTTLSPGWNYIVIDASNFPTIECHLWDGDSGSYLTGVSGTGDGNPNNAGHQFWWNDTTEVYISDYRKIDEGDFTAGQDM